MEHTKAHAYLQTMIKIPTKFPIDQSTTVSRVVSTKYPLSALFELKNDQVRNPEKVTKNNFRNILKAHAHLQTMTKALVKFQKASSTTRRCCIHKMPTVRGGNYGMSNIMSPHFSSKRPGTKRIIMSKVRVVMS